MYTADSNENTYNTLQREFCVPNAVSYHNMFTNWNLS